MRDGLLPEDDPLLSLSIFEGPMDLLLHLIRLNEINILDLPMEKLTHDYLATLKSMGKLEIPVAGEYFVMAAELLKIKSAMLLPRMSAAIDTTLAESSGPDPRAELVKSLMEYQELKKQSLELEKKMEETSLGYTIRKTAVERVRPLKPLDRFELMGQYAGVVRRLFERVALGEIVLDEYTISSAIEDVLQKLETSPRMSLGEIIKSGPQALPWFAALFVAVLELTRLGEIAPEQDESFGEIILTRLTPQASE